MAGIPVDLIIEILLRLPVEALLRFRCVSKRWRNLIDSPNFVKSHLTTPNKPKFVIVVAFSEKLCIYYSELDSDYIENPSPNFKELTLPRCDEIFSNVSDVVGHCNGLLCCVCENFRVFVLLNPWTRKHIQVPPPDQRRVRMWAWGFDYDRDSDDYKVVAIAYITDSDSGVVWIYSLKSGSWKTVGDFPYMLNYTDGVFVNGALHWIVHRKGNSSKFIFALHLGSLEYSLVAQPPDNSKNLTLGKLGVLDGGLYAIYFGYYDNIHCYELWVMTEYGLKESWTRLSTYTYDGPKIGRELLFVKYGDSLVQCQFGSVRGKLWLGGKAGSRPQGKPLVYEPSLVCP